MLLCNPHFFLGKVAHVVDTGALNAICSVNRCISPLLGINLFVFCEA